MRAAQVHCNGGNAVGTSSARARAGGGALQPFRQRHASLWCACSPGRLQLFLLSSAREHYDLTGDPQHAMRMALRSSGRVVLAAAGVMVAVFLTFALSGPLAPKEMGVILAVAVFLDAMLIRLVVLPVVLRIAGHAAWHRPSWLDKVLPYAKFAH